MYDIVIAGAGPAGSTLARLLDKKFSVLVIDRRNLSHSSSFRKIKSCGGLIAPDAQKELARLGFGVPHQVLTGPQIFTVRTIDMDNDIERYYQRHYINIDREKFDRWLFSLIPDHVEKRCDTLIKNIRQSDDCAEIEIFDGEKRSAIKTKYIVGADGADSFVRRMLRHNVNPKKYISIQEIFECDREMPYFSAIFDSSVSDFYSWTIPKGKNFLVGAALTPGNGAQEKFSILKEKLSFRGFNLSRFISREGAPIFRTVDSEQIFTGKDNLFLTGEAAGFISPSSSEGFSYAFRSSKSLAAAFNSEGDIHNSYIKNTACLRNNIFLKNFKSPAMYNSRIRSLIMRSGILSMDVMETND